MNAPDAPGREDSHAAPTRDLHRGRDGRSSPTTPERLAREIVQAHFLDAAAVRRAAACEDLHFAIAESDQRHSIDNPDGDRCGAFSPDGFLARAGSFEIQRCGQTLRQYARLKGDKGFVVVDCGYDGRWHVD